MMMNWTVKVCYGAFGRQPRVEGNCMAREDVWGGSLKQNGFLNVSEAS